MRTMNEYLSAKNGQLKAIEDLDSADTPDVVAGLRKVYVKVRKTDGSLYALKSFSSIPGADPGFGIRGGGVSMRGVWIEPW